MRTTKALTTWASRGIASAALAAGLMVPAVAEAQAMIKVNDTVNVKFGIQMQAWADFTQDTATEGYIDNLYLRRVRFLAAGQVAPDVTFFYCLDNPNLGKAPKSLGTGFITQDALITWKIANAFRLEGGLFIVPLSRNGLTSTIAYLTLDVSPTSGIFAAPTQTNGFRDTGFQARGYLLDRGQLEYRLAVTQGIRSAAVTGVDGGSRNSFRTTAFVNYNFFETENGYVLGGTNLGKKKVLAISSGVDTQATYSAYSGNIFTTLPTGKGGEFAGQVQWIHYDGGAWVPAILRQNDYLAELAFLIPGTKIQPFAKWEAQKFSDDFTVSKDLQRWGLGFNYNVSGQNLKLTAQYQKIKPDASTIPSQNQFTFQLQMFYF